MTANQPGKIIKELWVFVAVDESGDEGVTMFPTPDGPLPMVTAEEEHVRQMVLVAQRIASFRGVPVEVRHFTTVADVRVIRP